VPAAALQLLEAVVSSSVSVEERELLLTAR
jgi:hypothetical protein